MRVLDYAWTLKKRFIAQQRVVPALAKDKI